MRIKKKLKLGHRSRTSTKKGKKIKKNHEGARGGEGCENKKTETKIKQ